jgi:hypothetical protein
VGLLLLRLAVVAIFALNVTDRFHFTSTSLRWLVVSVIVLVSITLILGFLTAAVSVIVCVAAIASIFLTDRPIDVVHVLRILTSAALFFLGPGAYSVDARLFGLSVTVVPPRKDKHS